MHDLQAIRSIYPMQDVRGPLTWPTMHAARDLERENALQVWGGDQSWRMVTQKR